MKMLDMFGVAMCPYEQLQEEMQASDYIICVDSQKNAGNITDFVGQEVACIDHHPTYGWSITKPGDELLTFCIDNDLRDIRLNRTDEFSIQIPGASAFGGSSRKSSSRKYVCPLCGMSIRATRDVRILCMDCDTQMRCGA